MVLLTAHRHIGPASSLHARISAAKPKLRPVNPNRMRQDAVVKVEVVVVDVT